MHARVCAGIVSLALPISVLGTNFTTAWLDSKDGDQKQGRRAPPCVEELDEKVALHFANAGQS